MTTSESGKTHRSSTATTPARSGRDEKLWQMFCASLNEESRHDYHWSLLVAGGAQVTCYAGVMLLIIGAVLWLSHRAVPLQIVIVPQGVLLTATGVMLNGWYTIRKQHLCRMIRKLGGHLDAIGPALLLMHSEQEKQVTVAGQTRPLEEPFIVYATQNPIEHEGTYPLPEAQLDRFFFMLKIDYPSLAEERDIVLRTTTRATAQAHSVLSAPDVIALQEATLDVPLPDHVLDAVLKLVHASRPDGGTADDYIRKYVAWGAGPRASQNITRAAKALALLRGNPAATLEEVRDVARPVLRHRIIPNYNATGEGITAEQIVEHLLEKL